MQIRSNVTTIPAAPSADAAAHYAARLSFETDCSDVGADVERGVEGFVVVDVRSPELYAEGHVPGSINLPHRRITAETAAALIPPGVLVVTYCNGPHCNGSTRGALRFAELGIPVKEMIGGIDGWRRENLPVEIGV
jgi:rhodanese-related sulfurtransferase